MKLVKFYSYYKLLQQLTRFNDTKKDAAEITLNMLGLFVNIKHYRELIKPPIIIFTPIV